MGLLKSSFVFGVINLLNYINYCSGAIPIVVLHGLESSSEKMLPLCEWLGDTFSKKVINIERYLPKVSFLKNRGHLVNLSNAKQIP